MAKAVQDTVHFKITVRSHDRGGRWVAKTLETGVFTCGSTREEAEALNGEANEMLVRRMKQEGLRALARFMKERGLEYRIGGRRHRATKKEASWETTAMTELARAA